MPHPTSKPQQVHPAIYMMQQWQAFMDGVDRIITFYIAENTQAFEGIEWQRFSNNTSMPFQITQDVSKQLQHISSEKISHQWLRAELLPFINRDNLSINQLNLFSESEYLILLIRIQTAQTPILSYLFFRNDCSNFGLSDSNTQLEPSHKAIIGKMASQFASITINEFFAANQANEQFRKQTISILKSRHIEANSLKEQQTNWKISWLNTYLAEISQRDAVNYVISEAAQNKLLHSDVSFEQAKSSIDMCIHYICNLLAVIPGDEVLIEESYLIIDEPKVKVPIIDHNNQLINRSSKTMLLLDRLENAAIRVKQQGQSITSADVGSNMDKPITAPAISDALRKNRVRILQLFEQYPQRWSLIRQSFKPIMNISARKNTTLRSSG
ncbi:hypothetical protein [Carboxylicivirga marina]|uniref:hypothetical protein n=1 Tax=Carboxylicivirga marina TaxID=2800988 RepID=UPI0025937F77|nr:hypothetical protein [uncultured Carboxylicivirga sp.]